MPSEKLKQVLAKLKEDGNASTLKLEDDSFDIFDVLQLADTIRKNNKLTSIQLKQIRLDQMQLKVILTAAKQFVSTYMTALEFDRLAIPLEDKFFDLLATVLLTNGVLVELYLTRDQKKVNEHMLSRVRSVVFDLYSDHFKLSFASPIQNKAEVNNIPISTDGSAPVSPDGKWFVCPTGQNVFGQLQFHELATNRTQTIKIPLHEPGTVNLLWFSNSMAGYRCGLVPQCTYSMFIFLINEEGNWVQISEFKNLLSYSYITSTRKLYLMTQYETRPTTLSTVWKQEIQIWNLNNTTWNLVTSITDDTSALYEQLYEPERHELANGMSLSVITGEDVIPKIKIYDTKTAEHQWQLISEIPFNRYSYMYFVASLSESEAIFYGTSKDTYVTEVVVIDFSQGKVIASQKQDSNQLCNALKRFNKSLFYRLTSDQADKHVIEFWYLDHKLQFQKLNEMIIPFNYANKTLFRPCIVRALPNFDFICMPLSGEEIIRGHLLESNPSLLIDDATISPPVSQLAQSVGSTPSSVHSTAPLFGTSSLPPASFSATSSLPLTIQIGNCQIKIVFGSVLHQPVDAIVNAANEQLAAGGGVCGAIFTAAGMSQLTAACNQYPSGCKTGQAVLTDSFNLTTKHINYIIHAVGPIWDPNQLNQSRALLASAYQSSLQQAMTKTNIRKVAFPVLSGGIFGCPLDEAANAALQSVYDFLSQNTHQLTEVILACYLQSEFTIYCQAAQQFAQKNRMTISSVVTTLSPGKSSP